MGNKQARRFEIKVAERKNIPILIGLWGPSNGGKTKSALRLARGIQRVHKGPIVVADTESRRALHYADEFEFEHLDFEPPYSPLDYLDAANAAKAKGASVLIFDSGSHMHEGVGGLLDEHEEEVQRMAGGDYEKQKAVGMAGWVKPKRKFQEFKDAILHIGVPVIFCFRAKEKIKPAERGAADKTPKQLGYLPIINDELTFEMMLSVLLEPGNKGVPTWSPEKPDSRARIKLPGQFDAWFRVKKKDKQLDEDDGEMLARWAAGEAVEGSPKPRATTTARKQPPVFRPKLEWAGADEWRNKPLADAPLDVLHTYHDAVCLTRDEGAFTGTALAAINDHIKDIGDEMARKEPPIDEGVWNEDAAQ